MFTTIKKRIDQIYLNIEKPDIVIKVSFRSTQLKDGKQIKGQAFLTTPYVVAKGISKHLAEASIVAKVKYTKKYDSPLSKGLTSAEIEEEGEHKES